MTKLEKEFNKNPRPFLVETNVYLMIAYPNGTNEIFDEELQKWKKGGFNNHEWIFRALDRDYNPFILIGWL